MKNYKSKYQSDSNYKKFIKYDDIFNYNINLLESSGLVRFVDFNYIMDGYEKYRSISNVIFSGWGHFNNLEQLLEYIKKCKNNVIIYSPDKIIEQSYGISIALIETEVTRFQKINRLKTLMNEKKCLSLSKI